MVKAQLMNLRRYIGVSIKKRREKGLRPPANLSTENRTTVSSIAGTIQESRPPRNSRREVHDGRATSRVPRIPGASLYGMGVLRPTFRVA